METLDDYILRRADEERVKLLIEEVRVTRTLRRLAMKAFSRTLQITAEVFFAVILIELYLSY